jgi:DNA-binding NarL/FixJ family response regulator
MSRPAKRILIADDHDVVRRGLRTLLETRPHLEIIAETATGMEALAAAQATKPDIAILDYSLPELNGLELTIELHKALPLVEVVIYSMHDREDLIVDLFRAGARAFVLKSDGEEQLMAAIDAVSSHRPYFSGAFSEVLLAQFMRDELHTRPHALTHREREVVQLIAEGKLNKQVGHILNISIKTVETHRASAMQKLNLRTSAELIRYAVRNNLVEA